MQIEGNAKECEAMRIMHEGNKELGEKMQLEFVQEFRREYANKDHCPCRAACLYHGNCKECVAIHRAHQEHFPFCMWEIMNKRILELSKLTEDSLFIKNE